MLDESHEEGIQNIRKRLQTCDPIDRELTEIFFVALPYYELRDHANFLQNQKTKSYIKASEAFMDVVKDRGKDLVLKVEALAAFGQCYQDMGLNEHATKMTEMRDELFLKYS